MSKSHILAVQKDCFWWMRLAQEAISVFKSTVRTTRRCYHFPYARTAESATHEISRNSVHHPNCQGKTDSPESGGRCGVHRHLIPPGHWQREIASYSNRDGVRNSGRAFRAQRRRFAHSRRLRCRPQDQRPCANRNEGRISVCNGSKIRRMESSPETSMRHKDPTCSMWP